MTTKTKELRVTVEDVLRWEPCAEYTPARIKAIAKQFGKPTISALECLDLPIPANDRLWLALRREMIHGYTLGLIRARFMDMMSPKALSYYSMISSGGRYYNAASALAGWPFGRLSRDSPERWERNLSIVREILKEQQ